MNRGDGVTGFSKFGVCLILLPLKRYLTFLYGSHKMIMSVLIVGRILRSFLLKSVSDLRYWVDFQWLLVSRCLLNEDCLLLSFYFCLSLLFLFSHYWELSLTMALSVLSRCSSIKLHPWPPFYFRFSVRVLVVITLPQDSSGWDYKFASAFPDHGRLSIW